MRKQYTVALKAKIVIEMLQEEKTLAQLATQYKVSTKQLSRWKNHVLQEMPRLFEKQEKQNQEKYDHKIKDLYAEIGRLTTQVSWLKKSLASSLNRSERLALVEWEGSDLSLQG